MKFWARQVIRLSDGPSWTGSLQRRHVCMCEHACMCFSLSSSAPPKVLPFLCFPPPSVQRFPEYWPRSQKPVLAVSVLPVCSFFLAEWRCVLHVLLFEHAQLLVLFFRGEALVPSRFASEDFLGSSEPTSPWLMLWAGDSIFSSAPSAILCWTQLILQVLLMWKLWRDGADGCIAFSFLPSGLQPTILGSRPGKDQGFSQEYLRLWKTSCSLHSR